MRIVFMGTPEYAVPSLKALAASRHDLVGVLTQPDRPRGRSSSPVPSPVKRCALELGIPPSAILQPERPNSAEIVAAIRAMAPDLYCVIAYGCILGEELLEVPRLFALNAHGSLLPKYRGAAPIQAALLAGEKETGVTLMRMVRRMDAGPVLVSRSVPIEDTDTSGTMHEKLAEVSARLFLEGLELIESGCARFVEQDESLATYAPRLDKNSGRLDFSRPAVELERAVRAFNPWPVAWADLRLVPSRGEDRVRVHASRVVDAGRYSAGEPCRPGSLLACDGERGIVVACGDGTALRLTRVQFPGRRVMDDVAAARGLR